MLVNYVVRANHKKGIHALEDRQEEAREGGQTFREWRRELGIPYQRMRLLRRIQKRSVGIP
jgi:hypothetical protein